MKPTCFYIALLSTLALTHVRARPISAVPPGTPPSLRWLYLKYDSVANALSTADNAPLGSTFLAAVTAANLTFPADATSTLFAPTNAAFESPDLAATTGLTAAQLLEPANKEALVKLLSYHYVPNEAIQFLPNYPSDGQIAKTALTNEVLTFVSGGRWGKFSAKDATGKAAVVVGPPYNLEAGKIIIHFMDKVLIPQALVV